MNEYKKEVIDMLHEVTKLEKDKIDKLMEKPPSLEFGDYAFPCFILSKDIRKTPNLVAEYVLGKLQPTDRIEKIKTEGPYVNFFVNRKEFNKDVIVNVWKHKGNYGTVEDDDEKVMVEYSQPNTHKAFHVGHLRNVSIGDSIVKIMKSQGKEVIGANYIGDVGAHIAKCLWYYKKFYKGKVPKNNKGEWLGKLYTKAIQKLDENEEYKEEVSEVLQKLESENDNDIQKLWRKTKKWSIKDFKEIYGWLDVKFNKYFYESEVEKDGKKLVEKYKKKRLFKESEGALIMDLEEYGLGVFLVLKSDGTSLYSTKDLALAAKKFKEYKIDRSLYVVGSEQKTYFQQLFKTLELMGFKQADKCEHISYELVTLPDGKMSSREGNVIYFSELKEKVMKKLEKEVKKRHKKWTKKKTKKTAKQIALGALKFGMTLQDPGRIITFNLDEWTSFDGETGPYVQYACARINSMLRKYKDNVQTPEYGRLNTGEEQRLISMIEEYPDKVSEAASSYKPSIIARHILDIAQLFNEFYHKYPVLRSEDGVKEPRIMLIRAVKQVLENGLGLLGIKAPEEM